MAIYIMLTRIDPAAVQDKQVYLELNKAVADRINTECPDIKWLANYAVLGPYDYLDIFEAPSHEAAARVALLVRSKGHAETEIWGAIPWDTFKTLLESSRGDVVEEADIESFPASDAPSWTGATIS